MRSADDAKAATFNGKPVYSYGFGRNTVLIAALNDREWILTIDAQPKAVFTCPLVALKRAKEYLGVEDVQAALRAGATGGSDD